MLNTINANSFCTSGAIQVAADYTNNSKTDWHLPSKNELAELYVRRTTVGGFSTGAYWSSSELGGSTAWGQNFNFGMQGYDYKVNAYYVRPVRAFG